MIRAEADPGSVKRGGRESKLLDVAPENKIKIGQKNKNRPKKGGPRPIRPPLGSATVRVSQINTNHARICIALEPIYNSGK